HRSGEALAAGSIADLVVVLQEVDEGAGRQVSAALATRPTQVARGLTLVGEALRQAAAQERLRLPRIVGVVTAGLPAQQDVQAVVGVVVPLRVAGRGGARGAEKAHGVVEVLEREVDRAAAAFGRTRRAGDLVDDVRFALVVNGVDRIETQAVEVVFLEPVKRVVDEELTHRRTVRSVKVDRGTPGGGVPLG